MSSTGSEKAIPPVIPGQTTPGSKLWFGLSGIQHVDGASNRRVLFRPEWHPESLFWEPATKREPRPSHRTTTPSPATVQVPHKASQLTRCHPARSYGTLRISDGWVFHAPLRVPCVSLTRTAQGLSSCHCGNVSARNGRWFGRPKTGTVPDHGRVRAAGDCLEFSHRKVFVSSDCEEEQPVEDADGPGGGR